MVCLPAAGLRRRRAARWLIAVTTIACVDSVTSPSQARIEITPDRVDLYQSQSLPLTATVFDARGAISADGVTWTTALEAIANVSTDGEVFAVSPGETTITATSGSLSKSARVTVRRDSLPPVLDQVSIAPAVVDLSSGDGSVTITFRARDAESGISFNEVSGDPPVGPAQLRRYAEQCTQASGTTKDGAWQCVMRIHRYTTPGVWRALVWTHDFSILLFDSATVPFTVANPLPDTTPPVLTTLTFTNERTTFGGQESRIVVVGGADAESGILDVEFLLADGASPGVYSCGGQPPNQWDTQGKWTPAPEVTARCPVPLVASSTPVLRTLSARVRDARGNVREYSAEELQQAGFIAQIDIAK